MKLEVGMYIRTKNGKIRKIISIYPTGDLLLDSNTCYKKENIVGKPSFYPIDLIKIGDYVNGFLINKIDKENKIVWHITHSRESHMAFNNENIITILTKEQFENNCYKVGD